MSLSGFLADPAWIPHALDGDGVVMIKVSPGIIRDAAFLDGREPIGTDVCVVSRDAFVAARADWPEQPLPTILHVSFCGSTLLARLLDRPPVLVYREPAIQIELADRLAAGEPVEQLTLAATAALARRVGGATAVVKPSNWANGLLPLWVEHRAIDPLFVTMSAPAFLTAVFRGGRDRIAFTMRVAQHLAASVPAGRELVQQAIESQTNALDRAATLTLVALALQCRLMADARRNLGLGAETVIKAEDIAADPGTAAKRAAHRFGLGSPNPAPALTHHAKSGSAFFRDVELRSNAEIEASNRSSFDRALNWADRQRLSFGV